jgi:hypothetical protein
MLILRLAKHTFLPESCAKVASRPQWQVTR